MNDDNTKLREQIETELERVDKILIDLNEELDKQPSDRKLNDLKTKIKEKEDDLENAKSGSDSAEKKLAEIARQFNTIGRGFFSINPDTSQDI